MYSVKIAEGANKKTLPYIKICIKKASRRGLLMRPCSGSQARPFNYAQRQSMPQKLRAA
jgi:hypothetical protein